jgi:hypothetical protein
MRSALLAALLLLAACGQPAPDPDAPEALIDLDPAATTALQEEVRRLPPGPEAGPPALARLGFDCAEDPTRPGEIACQRTRIEGDCALTAVVTTPAGAPLTARAFRACWPGGVPDEVRTSAAG